MARGSWQPRNWQVEPSLVMSILFILGVGSNPAARPERPTKPDLSPPGGTGAVSPALAVSRTLSNATLF